MIMKFYIAKAGDKTNDVLQELLINLVMIITLLLKKKTHIQ